LFTCFPLFTSLFFVQSTNAMMTHPIKELKTDMMNNISTYVYTTYEQAVISMIVLQPPPIPLFLLGISFLIYAHFLRDTGMSVHHYCVLSLKILCVSSGPFKFPVSTMHNYIRCIVPHWVILQHTLFRNLHPDCEYSCND